jgi:hypothetical protein
MKKESRIIITNLSTEQAIALLPNVKELAKGAHFELDTPDPPDLLEKDYDKVNKEIEKLFGLLDDADCGWGEAKTKKQVLADIKKLRTLFHRIEYQLGMFRLAVTRLEVAAGKLGKQK